MSNEYRVFETDQFSKDLDRIAKSGRTEMERKIRRAVYPQLRANPYYGPNVRTLRNYQPETWRYRIGAWRFFYEVDATERVIYMIAASHRSSAY